MKGRKNLALVRRDLVLMWKNRFFYKSRELILTLDRKGIIINFNKAVQNIFNKFNELRGELFLDIFDEGKSDIWNSFLADIDKQGSYNFKGRILSEKGKIIWIDWQLIKNKERIEAFGRNISDEITTGLTLQRRLKQLIIENKISRRISSILDLDELLPRVVKDIQEGFSYHNVILLQYDKEKGELGRQSMAGSFVKFAPPNYTQSDAEGLIGKAARTGEITLCNNVTMDEDYVVGFLESVPTLSEVAVPVIFGGEVIAVLDIQETIKDAFDEIDMRTLQTISSQIGIAMNNAGLYKKAKHEISVRKIAEENLKKNEIKLKKLNHWKDKIFSIIAHDLKGPFQSLLSSAELLRTELHLLSAKDVESLVSGIYTKSKNASRVVNDLLEWSKLQFGNENLKTADHELREILSNSYSFIEGSLSEKRLSLRNNDVNKKLFVNCDKDSAVIILRNILMNAVKFSYPGGEIEISVINSESEVTVSISDHGIGIEEELLKDLFSDNRIISHRGTAGEGGVGIGLNLCKILAEKNGINIRAESEPGKGSTFFISFLKAKVH